MSATFFLTKLKDDAKQKDYEKWVKESDYSIARKIDSIIFYRVYRITESLQNEVPYDYIEHIKITNSENYKKDLESEEAKKLLEQWSEYIGESKAFFGEEIKYPGEK